MPWVFALSIHDKLIEWGRGRAMDKAPNGYPSETPFSRMSRNAGSWGISMPDIPEVEFLAIDRKVSEWAVDPTREAHHAVIVLCYVYNKADSSIARHLRISRGKVRELRMNAEGVIEGFLDSQKIA